MKKFLCLSTICLLALSVSGCHQSFEFQSAEENPSEVKEEAQKTLDQYPGAEYHLRKMKWEGENTICRTGDTHLRGRDLLMQLATLPGYDFPGSLNQEDLFFSKAEYALEDKVWKGSIEIVLKVQDYAVEADPTTDPKPSEVGNAFVFNTFFLLIPYTIDEDGHLSCGEYISGKTYSTWDETAHLDCYVDLVTEDVISVVFPDYLVPDYATDRFYTGPVTMEFWRY